MLDGDVAEGPFPAETLDLLAALGERALWVRGNSDRSLVEAFDGVFQPTGGAADELVRWASASLTRQHRDRLAALPLTVSVDIAGLGAVGICHATARSDDEVFLVDSSIKHFREAFAGLEERTLVVGHSHMPFDRLFDRKRLINAGSVGMPYGHVGASWALLGPDAVLRRTAYDVETASARMAATRMPGVRAFIEANVRTAPSDVEALQAFGKTRWAQRSTGRFG